ncbi:ATP-binding protein [Bradyrhizobium sp. CCGB01]|uniref:ATP-binding protein n=1 Tax=Bradyrhizobium sp. CCGB01 TaxID=2949634 RepID=UPI0020B310B9|nr:ATP-binding protein [Bradyrhizobium sp. CCGB01]MCP3411240.1 MASE4 domain-containing protein [Bradyrhizobium sp. CCGB01]
MLRDGARTGGPRHPLHAEFARQRIELANNVWRPGVAAPQSFDDTVISLAIQPAGPRHLRFVLIVVVVLCLAFIALLPFQHTQLPEFNAIEPSVAAVMSINDLITSVLLYAQCSIVPSRRFLVLATGYLFTALIIIPHALTFPGAFTVTGLIGAGPQTSPWLFFAAHFVFPATLLCYALLRGTDDESPLPPSWALSGIYGSIAIVVFSVGGLTLLSTAGHEYLPTIVSDRTHAIPAHLTIINVSIIALTVISLAALWTRRRTVLDYWLTLISIALILEEACFSLAVLRFSVGFYAGRVFWLFTSIVVLLLLLLEITKLYARLARSYTLLERERNNKLLNIQATAASIAHEVRQPLTAIVASGGAALHYLEKTPPDHEKIRKSLRRMISESERTSKVFDGIRALFGRVDQRREAVDVNEIIRDVLKSVEGELSDNEIAVSSELNELSDLDGNRTQLQQVMFNLVHNAIEAMQCIAHRRRALRVRTERRVDSAIKIVMEDTGPGIDPTQLDSIFNAFVTTKPAGMGLGLAICRQIIERHGGHLIASSDGSSGAKFEVVLPAGPANGAGRSN